MGSGASTLSNEQKAVIAKEMKEKYENISPEEQANAHVHLMEHYEALVAKLHAEAEQQIGASGSGIKKKPRKKIARLRSFENGNFLLENVAHPKKEPVSQEQDFWDSVSTQPSCLVCKMVFISKTKLDTHMKYSEVHKQNLLDLQVIEDLAKGIVKETPPEPVKPPELPSFRCRELYSGSKFYWRLQVTIEYHIYLHLETNEVEVIPYDHHTQTEYPRLYFAEEKLFQLAGPDKIHAKVQARMAESENDDSIKEKPLVEDVTADERRQHVCALLLSKLQVEVTDPATKAMAVRFKITVSEDVNPLLPDQPKELQPVLVNRRRLSTTEEIEAALQSASEMELKIKVKLHEAEDLENLAHVVVSNSAAPSTTK